MNNTMFALEAPPQTVEGALRTTQWHISNQELARNE